MRKLKFSIASNLFDTNWQNCEKTWEDIQKMFSDAFVVSETLQEYNSLPKEKRKEIKDHGCFVGGYILNGIRKKENIIFRSIVTLDADNASPSFVSGFENDFEFAAILHTTFCSTPQNPRVRLIIPLSRDVTPEEYTILSGKIIKMLGEEQFDKCSVSPEQLMFLPSRPSDGVFIIKSTANKACLDPDRFLEGSAKSDKQDNEGSNAIHNGCVEDDSSQHLMTVDEVRSLLSKTFNGQIANSLSNYNLILQNDPNLQSIAYDALEEKIVVQGDVPWRRVNTSQWNEFDQSCLRSYIDEKYGIFNKAMLADAINKVAAERVFNPVVEYLCSLPSWDGVSRIETLFIDYLGAEDNSYIRAVTRKTMVAAVARAFKPGIKFDTVPVLIGGQGIGKSTLIKKLGKRWFTDSLTLTDMKSKDAAEKIQGYWLIEISELVGMRKTEIETVKSFLSKIDDVYRVAYQQYASGHLRKCVFFATTNAESGFLRDTTGNRRFWPVNVSGNSRQKPWELTTAEVDLFWAEAYSYYLSGEPLTLSAEDEKEANAEQLKAIEHDDREGVILKYLETPLPGEWKHLPLEERMHHLQNEKIRADAPQLQKRTFVAVIEIWCECFGKNIADIKQEDRNKIISILKKNGWRSTGRRENLGIYGQQRVYEAPEDR